MALAKCLDCGSEVSTEAKACPQCGRPPSARLKCAECGKRLLPDETACPKCGCPVGEGRVADPPRSRPRDRRDGDRGGGGQGGGTSSWTVAKGILLALFILVVVPPVACTMCTGFFVIPNADRFEKKAKIEKDLETFRQGLRAYKKRNGRFPTTEEGLYALARERVIPRVPLDPWGAQYQYRLDKGARPGAATATVLTLGGDGLPGGELTDEDVVLTVE